jgi:uncharacterized protein (TIGR04255 family)
MTTVASARPNLPEFSHPPVSEVAISVEFHPLAGFKVAHAGRYWAEVADRFPETETQLPLPSQLERFGQDAWRQPNVQVEFADPSALRHWFMASDGQYLIQVQRDRFILNWRKISAVTSYPRYDASLRPRFLDEYDHFTGFLKRTGLQTPEIRQCEITYVNDLASGGSWNSFSDALSLFAPWWGKGTDGFLSLPSNLNVNGAFDMPSEAGRLYFAVDRKIRLMDNAEVVQFRLTARGEPPGATIQDAIGWIDRGREWIVRGFADLTSPSAHKLWGRL